MDYFTQQFIAASKKLREELQKITGALSALHSDFQNQIDAINEASDANSKRDKSPPPLFAELQIPHAVQAEKRASDRRKQRRERWALFVQWATFFAVLYYAIVAHRQLQKTQGAVDAANRNASAAETANTNAVTAERPWIGLNQFSPENLEPDTPATALFVIINAGKRPALVQFEFSMHRYKRFPKTPQYGVEPTEPSSTLLVPGVTLKSGRPFIITKQDIADMAAKHETMYLYGHIEYIDVGRNQSHTTLVCERYIPSLKIFATCPDYNGAN
jgi:hypothetical protein